MEQARVVHNDMKSDNLMWVKGDSEKQRPCVKIVDFGCARLDQREDPSRNWNLAEGGQGHLGKWPPEMVLQLPITHVADVWGLAVALCELHCGRSMWRGDADSVEVILAQSVGLCNLREGLPQALLQQSPIDVCSFITPGPRHLPVCRSEQGHLEVLEPQAWGLEPVLGKNWDASEKKGLGELLQAALVIAPSERPTASQLLETCEFVKPVVQQVGR